MDFLDFQYNNTCAYTVETNAEIPKDLDIFFRNEAQFLPPGKTWADLTEEEKKIIRNRYRFDPFKPGLYQTITGLGPMG